MSSDPFGSSSGGGFYNPPPTSSPPAAFHAGSTTTFRAQPQQHQNQSGSSASIGINMRQPTPPQAFHPHAGGPQHDPFGGAPSSVGFGGGSASYGGGSHDGFYTSPMGGSSSQTPPPSSQQPTFFAGGLSSGGSSSQFQDLSMSGNGAVPPSEIHRTRFGFAEDDLPLLQELGVFPRHIQAKALAVLNPFSPNAPDVVEDMDLAGPVMFAVALGFLLSLQGKVQFSAIYGLSLLGIGFAKMLLTLMCDQHDVSVQFVVSTLGYCLLPNLVLAALQTLQHWLIGSHAVILPVAFVVIGWSAWCATTMFSQALSMEAQRYLILYPCVLFYAVFAALTIF